MKKIPSLFVRDYEDVIARVDSTNEKSMSTKGRFLARQIVTPGCEWVIAGEGIATRKWDGTAILIKEGIMYKRYDAKNGKIPPDGFIPCQEPDDKTGHWPGWIQCFNADQSNKYIFDAFANTFSSKNVDPVDGTYEAIGPKIGGNKDKKEKHILAQHGFGYVPIMDRSFDSIKLYLSLDIIEGIVFYHLDGRMCKVKRSDFGLPW